MYKCALVTGSEKHVIETLVDKALGVYHNRKIEGEEKERKKEIKKIKEIEIEIGTTETKTKKGTETETQTETQTETITKGVKGDAKEDKKQDGVVIGNEGVLLGNGKKLRCALPIDLTVDAWEIAAKKINKYLYTPKADGMRYLLICLQGKVYTIDREYNVYSLGAQLDNQSRKSNLDFILDGEYIEIENSVKARKSDSNNENKDCSYIDRHINNVQDGEKKHKSIHEFQEQKQEQKQEQEQEQKREHMYFVFDCIYLQNDNLCTIELEKRLNYLNYLQKEGVLNCIPLLKCVLKPVYELHELPKHLTSINKGFFNINSASCFSVNNAAPKVAFEDEFQNRSLTLPRPQVDSNFASFFYSPNLIHQPKSKRTIDEISQLNPKKTGAKIKTGTEEETETETETATTKKMEIKTKITGITNLIEEKTEDNTSIPCDGLILMDKFAPYHTRSKRNISALYKWKNTYTVDLVVQKDAVCSANTGLSSLVLTTASASPPASPLTSASAIDSSATTDQKKCKIEDECITFITGGYNTFGNALVFTEAITLNQDFARTLNDYFEVKNSSECIVECKAKMVKSVDHGADDAQIIWIPLKIRTDKSKPNFETVVEGIKKCVINPLTLDDMCRAIERFKQCNTAYNTNNRFEKNKQLVNRLDKKYKNIYKNHNNSHNQKISYEDKLKREARGSGSRRWCQSSHKRYKINQTI